MPTARVYDDKQRRIDAVLPAFLVGSPMDGPVGTRWATLADLVLARDDDWSTSDDRSHVGIVVDLGRREAADTLPRGSTLRMLEPFWEMLAPGHVAGVFFDFDVEDGPLAGTVVTVYEGIRLSWHGTFDRRPLAVAMIVPADSSDVHDTEAKRRRYKTAIEVLESDPPPRNPIPLPRAPLTRPTDAAALGEAS